MCKVFKAVVGVTKKENGRGKKKTKPQAGPKGHIESACEGQLKKAQFEEG